MNSYEKLEAIHCAIQEALNGNVVELEQALVLVEQLRERYLTKEVSQ